VLASQIQQFLSFHDRDGFGTNLEGLRNFGEGGLNTPTPSVRHWFQVTLTNCNSAAGNVFAACAAWLMEWQVGRKTQSIQTSSMRLTWRHLPRSDTSDNYCSSAPLAASNCSCTYVKIVTAAVDQVMVRAPLHRVLVKYCDVSCNLLSPSSAAGKPTAGCITCVWRTDQQRMLLRPNLRSRCYITTWIRLCV